MNEDYCEIYYIIVNYERTAGINSTTKNIKRYAIFNIINNEFLNIKILEKKNLNIKI